MYSHKHPAIYCVSGRRCHGSLPRAPQARVERSPVAPALPTRGPLTALGVAPAPRTPSCVLIRPPRVPPGCTQIATVLRCAQARRQDKPGRDAVRLALLGGAAAAALMWMLRFSPPFCVSTIEPSTRRKEIWCPRKRDPAKFLILHSCAGFAGVETQKRTGRGLQVCTAHHKPATSPQLYSWPERPQGQDN